MLHSLPEPRQHCRATVLDGYLEVPVITAISIGPWATVVDGSVSAFQAARLSMKCAKQSGCLGCSREGIVPIRRVLLSLANVNTYF